MSEPHTELQRILSSLASPTVVALMPYLFGGNGGAGGSAGPGGAAGGGGGAAGGSGGTGGIVISIDSAPLAPPALVDWLSSYEAEIAADLASSDEMDRRSGWERLTVWLQSQAVSNSGQRRRGDHRNPAASNLIGSSAIQSRSGASGSGGGDELLSQDVHMTGMASGFLDHVSDDLAERVMPTSSRLGAGCECRQVGVLADDPIAVAARSRIGSNHFFGLLVGRYVHRHLTHDVLAQEDQSEPVSFDICQVIDHTEDAGARRHATMSELRLVERLARPDDRKPHLVQVVQQDASL